MSYYHRTAARRSSRSWLIPSVLLGVLVGALVLWNIASAPQPRPYSVNSVYLPEDYSHDPYYNYYNPTPAAVGNAQPTARPSNPQNPVGAQPVGSPIVQPTRAAQPQPPKTQYTPIPPYAAPPVYDAPPTIVPGVVGAPIAPITSTSPVLAAPITPTDETVSLPIPVNKPVYTQAVGPISVKNGQLVDGIGARFFLSGINYEGHTDRAWVMWNNDRFDTDLIQRNFQAAAAGGYNTVRVFVQSQLREDILKGDFGKLDKLVDIARQNNLFILLTFADYYELDIRKLTKVDEAVAQHYVNNPWMLGYDLKNEPQFADVASSIYPDSIVPPFQTEVLIKTYGEKLNLQQANEWRKTNEGGAAVPGSLDERKGYYVANAYKLMQDYLNDAEDYANKNNLTTLDYMSAPEAAKWRPFIDAASGTLQSYMEVRQGAIRQFDKAKPTTIGWNKTFWGRLPANANLGFVSVHRYAPVGESGLRTTFAVLDSLKRAFPGKAVCLEEFGYSNSTGPNSKVSQEATASNEAAVWLYLYGKGFAGGFKWMLNNFSIGANVVENNFGLLDDQDKPKLSYGAARVILRMANANRTPGGDFEKISGNDEVEYAWSSGSGIFGNGQNFSNSRVKFEQDKKAPWAIWWPNNGIGQVYIAASSNAKVSLDLKSIFPTWNGKQRPELALEDGQAPTFNVSSTSITFQATAGTLYTLSVPVLPAAFSKVQPLGGANSIYFKETGHNVSNAFRNFWQQRSGDMLLGLPISEEFQESGYTVQYFERGRLELHPELGGTPSEVQLGLLGSLVTSGRKASGEAPFKAITSFASTADRIYFKETSHSLSSGFRQYWEKYGGVAQFGYPVSEEFSQISPLDGKTYTVQYFERGRLEYHPEAKGTPYEIQPGLIGLEILKARGWIQ